ncbi:MAG TPA: alpha-amylase, partial [Opitutae bacterium]|nr:alpha-amylase [Opitutae bacterium]
MKTPLRFRQVHLDFHTSGSIQEIGSRFDKQAFQDTLKQAAVNSVSTFATCHHGWSYYNTKVGQRHPGLSFDLLRAQFEACKEVDINVPIYLTAGVHNLAAEEHPEWREVGPDGRYVGWAPSNLDAGFQTMSFHSPYLDYLCEQIREVMALFPEADGIFLDIIDQGEDCSVFALQHMQAKGLDPLKPEDRLQSRLDGLM